MNESECLARMIGPGDKRPKKPRKGAIQILVTSACDKACSNCTQASSLKRPRWYMTEDQFEIACQSLSGYWGTIGVFGGNPCTSPLFPQYCARLRDHFPQSQCGLWSNNIFKHGEECRKTFSAGLSNLNVHEDQKAFDNIRATWPEARPFGLQPSSHSPVFVSMTDIGVPEAERWELISKCSINQNWSAGIGVFRGELRAWFCEIAMSQSILKQHDPEYPDTGVEVVPGWWQRPMQDFSHQVRQHCHNCSVPLNGRGHLDHVEHTQVSQHYAPDFRPKRGTTEIVTTIEQLEAFAVEKVTEYRKNAH